jgi:hypothetical protein
VGIAEFVATVATGGAQQRGGINVDSAPCEASICSRRRRPARRSLPANVSMGVVNAIDSSAVQGLVDIASITHAGRSCGKRRRSL